MSDRRPAGLGVTRRHAELAWRLTGGVVVSPIRFVAAYREHQR